MKLDQIVKSYLSIVHHHKELNKPAGAFDGFQLLMGNGKQTCFEQKILL